MTESKDFRSGTRTLLWEKDKLAMEYQDLQMKWTEIQQTKVCIQYIVLAPLQSSVCMIFTTYLMAKNYLKSFFSKILTLCRLVFKSGL